MQGASLSKKLDGGVEARLDYFKISLDNPYTTELDVRLCYQQSVTLRGQLKHQVY